MFRTYYVLKLHNSKYLYRLYYNNIFFFKIKYRKNNVFLYVNEDNYQKIKRYIQIYDLELIKIGGKNYYLSLLKSKKIFLGSFFFSLLILFFLSNIIFDVQIMSNNEEIIRLLKKELDNHNLKKFQLIKSYDEQKKIKNDILKTYPNSFEWLEIERKGTKYYIKVLERIINQKKDNNCCHHVTSKKNAIILDIKAEKGEIVRKINDYVNKGDILISGNITRNDDVKDTVDAKGTIYGEVWYNVRVEIPMVYEDIIYTGNQYDVFTINVFNKRWEFGNKEKYVQKKYIDTIIIDNYLLPFSFNKTTVLEIQKTNKIYSYDLAVLKGMSIAKDKLLMSIPQDSKIISQKKLKLYQENNIIVVEVFFKVYENITSYKEIEKVGE